MISLEQAKEIKTQLLTQLEQTNLPNKEEVKASIGAMNSEQLGDFLKQNNLLKEPESSQADVQQCVFCAIVSGDIKSQQIDENKDAIAVLEINPASRGHVIVIPKKHLPSPDQLPETALSLANEISEKIKSGLNAKEVSITPSNLFGHEILNIIPQYEDPTLNEKHQATPEELEEIKSLLEPKPEPEVVKEPETKTLDEKTWLPRRVP